MYKFLLCWRYLRTRYIALASILSVMLGVATMIVVNSVMSGFTTEMQKRLHGILSDLVLEVRSLDGAPDAEAHMERIRAVAAEAVQGMTPTVVVPALLSFHYAGQWFTRQVQVIGIDEATQGQVSDFAKYLQHPDNRRQMSFQLREGGYDVRDHQAGPESPERPQMGVAGWSHRRQMAALRAAGRPVFAEEDHPLRPQEPPEPPPDPFRARDRDEGRQEQAFDMATQQHTGLVMGIVLASYREQDGRDRFLLLPGDDVKLILPTALSNPGADRRAPVTYDYFTVVDFYECKMSEYDASFVFVPIAKLQQLRGMFDPATGQAMFNSIQIKLRPGTDDQQVRDLLQAAFPRDRYLVQTWRDKQGPLLAAVHMETAILNVLLFLIIAVSGFGILAIFFMIVVEKTRDIGILKSLGASGPGIMGIFLSYGLSLGLVGSGGGLVLGLLFVRHINAIADVLGRLTGRPLFDPSVYYFHKIPTLVDPWTVAWVVLGAVGIAVLASVLPALRAAVLHPVEALRYE
ncbi:MAG: ABC transporter permease [Thermoguttaceae bacterium]